MIDGQQSTIRLLLSALYKTNDGTKGNIKIILKPIYIYKCITILSLTLAKQKKVVYN